MLVDIIQEGSELQVSYWGSDHKTHIERIHVRPEEQFNWVLNPISKHDKKSDTFKNWNGKPAYIHKLNVNDKRDSLNKYRLYEIVDDMPDEVKSKIFDYNLPDMYFVDIETEVTDGFPEPEKADQKITLIGMCCPNDTIAILSIKDLSQKEKDSIQQRIDQHFSQVNRKFKFIFKYFPKEYDMLHYFLSKVVPKIPMMTGWNFVEFDWTYIVNRAKNLGIDPRISSPSGILVGKDNRPAHVGIIDYLMAYKKWTWNTNENYKLDTIGEKLVGIKKVAHAESLQDMYENDFEKYVYYNAIDCGLVKLIHENCNALTCGLTTAWLGRIKAHDCFSTTFIPENLLRMEFRKDNKVLCVDPLAKKDDVGKKYEGAFVKAPVPGLHKNVICNDYSSLYPTILRMFNVGPETFVTLLPEGNEEKKQEWKDKGYIVCASGAVYKREDGKLKRIVSDLYAKRKAYKKQSFKYKQNYYDLKDMVKRNVSDEVIIEYMVKNELPGKTMSNLDNVMHWCLVQSDIYNNFQLGTKVVINGIYGAFGFLAFYFYNRDLAESVTKQGKNAILNANKISDAYFQQKWHLDKETHKKMGITIKPGTSVKESIVVYDDTDSQYSSLEEPISTTDWMEHKVWRLTKLNKKDDSKSFVYVSQGLYPTMDDAKMYFDTDSIDSELYEWEIDEIEPDGREFALTFNRVFWSDFMKKVHDKYGEKNGVKNLLDFELEAYSDAGIWLAKKKYVKNVTWEEPNVYYDKLTHIKPTGIEIAQTSSSVWVKKKLTDMITWIFAQEKFSIDNFVKELAKVRREFMLQSIENVSVNKGMNKYADYVLNDTTRMELGQKAMVTVQGACFYNYLLNTHKKFKNKYSTLVDSDKLCVVYIKPSKYVVYKSNGKGGFEECPVEAFSYPAGGAPLDMMSFEVDYNRMFELLILGPLNRIIEAMGYQPLSPELTFVPSLW